MYIQLQGHDHSFYATKPKPQPLAYCLEMRLMLRQTKAYALKRSNDLKNKKITPDQFITRELLMCKKIRILALLFASLFSIAACEVKDQLPIDEGDGGNNGSDGGEISINRITYAGKISNITDFRGYGQYLYYFPAFNLDSPDDRHRTDKDAVYFNRYFKDFLHHALLDLETRTFSPDAGGNPLGVKARGGHKDWAVFTLPNGRIGISGTIYDDATRNNSNNTVNQINFTNSSPREFCLNIITDNTKLENIPDEKLVARTDQSREDLSLEGHPDLKFDGKPDMYTFRYENMTVNSKIKIKMRTTKLDGKEGQPITGAGFAGIMISDYSTCSGQ